MYHQWFSKSFVYFHTVIFWFVKLKRVEVIGILCHAFFAKNFVKVTVLLNKLLKSWFDEIFFWWERISRFSTLWESLIIHGIFCHSEFLSHPKIQINSLVTYLVKPLLSRNFCQKCLRENFRNFHTVHPELG